MNYTPLSEKIICNGIKPTKFQIYTLAAELQDIHKFKYFSEAIISALMSHDYFNPDYPDYPDDYYDYYDYYYDDYYDYYYYHYYHYHYYHYHYDYHDNHEKVIALLFLAAMYS